MPLTGQSTDPGPIEGGVVHQVVVAQPLEPSEQSLRHLQLHRVVEPAPTAAELHLGVAKDVISESQARRDLVGKAPLESRSGEFREIAEGWNFFFLEAKSEVQGECAVDRPAVLKVEGIPVRAGVCHDAVRYPQVVITARIVAGPVRTGTGAGTDRPVHHGVRAGIVVQNVIELVRFIDVVCEPVELPAEAQVMLLVGGADQVAPTQRHRALLLEILRRVETCVMSDGEEITGSIQGIVGRESDQPGRLTETVTDLAWSQELLGLDGVQPPSGIHDQDRRRRDRRSTGKRVARVCKTFLCPLESRVGGAVAIGQSALPVRPVRNERGHESDFLGGLKIKPDGRTSQPVLALERAAFSRCERDGPRPRSDLRQVCAEEPGTVAPYRSAHGEAVFVPRVIVFGVEHVFGDVNRLGRVEAQTFARRPGQQASTPVPQSAAVKLVGSALGLDAQHAAHCAFEFRLVSGGLQLELLHCFDAQVLVVQPVVHARRIDTVNVENVLRTGGPIDGYPTDFAPFVIHVARLGFDVDARREARVVGEVATASGIRKPLTCINRCRLALESVSMAAAPASTTIVEAI